MRASKQFAVIFVVVAFAFWLGGCATPEQSKSDASIPRGDPPAFAEIAKKHNERVAGLDRLWARSTVRFQGVDNQGQSIDEQGEGHLQVIRPRKLYMTVGKVGDVGYELGSDDYRYWWIDVREKFALVGKHEQATGQRLEKAGLPVPPLDVLAVLGITELRQEGSRAPNIEWSADGRRLIVTLSREDGVKELRLDPDRYEPLEVVLRNKAGVTTVRAKLSEYAPVANTEKAAGGGGVASRMAMNIQLAAPMQKTEITLWLHDAENRGNKMKEKAFDFDSLVREYRVQRVRDLDDIRTGNAS